MTLISVILAVYNQDKYLSKCLKSLSKQKQVKFEIILVDDGSKNKLIIKNEKLKNNKIRFFRIAHSGPALARNFGAQKARGEILVFLDGDMEFEPDFLKKLVEPILKKQAKGAYSSEEFVANWENIWARCWNFENGLKGKRRISQKQNMIKDFRAILKSEFEKVGGFDNIGYTDTWSLSEKLNYLPIITQAKYHHYNPSSLIEVFNQAKWIGGRQRKFGVVGKILALLRASLPISIIAGSIKSIQYKQVKFLLFKLIYDLGITFGIISCQIKK
jgi:glycosyltransferase involved in cell wall biosynthesis